MGKARAAQKLLNLIRLCRIAVQKRWIGEGEVGAERMRMERGPGPARRAGRWRSRFHLGLVVAPRETPARPVRVSNWHRYRRVSMAYDAATADSRAPSPSGQRGTRATAPPCLCRTYIVLNIIVKVRSCAGITTVSTIYVIVARQEVLSHRRAAPRHGGRDNRCARELCITAGGGEGTRMPVIHFHRA